MFAGQRQRASVYRIFKFQYNLSLYCYFSHNLLSHYYFCQCCKMFKIHKWNSLMRSILLTPYYLILPSLINSELISKEVINIVV